MAARHPGPDLSPAGATGHDGAIDGRTGAEDGEEHLDGRPDGHHAQSKDGVGRVGDAHLDEADDADQEADAKQDAKAALQLRGNLQRLDHDHAENDDAKVDEGVW